MTFADLYNNFTKDVLPDALQEWDNLSWDGEDKLESIDACRHACEDDKECFQFSYDGETCHFGHSIHLGEYKPSDNGRKWRSGWLKDRINEWVDEQGPCRPEFPWT